MSASFLKPAPGNQDGKWMKKGRKLNMRPLSLVHTVKGLVGECDIGVISWGDIKAICYRKTGLGNYMAEVLQEVLWSVEQVAQ